MAQELDKIIEVKCNAKSFPNNGSHKSWSKKSWCQVRISSRKSITFFKIVAKRAFITNSRTRLQPIITLNFFQRLRRYLAVSCYYTRICAHRSSRTRRYIKVEVSAIREVECKPKAFWTQFQTEASETRRLTNTVSFIRVFHLLPAIKVVRGHIAPKIGVAHRNIKLHRRVISSSCNKGSAQ